MTTWQHIAQRDWESIATARTSRTHAHHMIAPARCMRMMRDDHSPLRLCIVPSRAVTHAVKAFYADSSDGSMITRKADITWRIDFARKMYDTLQLDDVSDLFRSIVQTGVTKLQVLAKSFYTHANYSLFPRLLDAFNTMCYGCASASVEECRQAMKEPAVQHLSQHVRSSKPLWHLVPGASLESSTDEIKQLTARAIAHVVFACLTAAKRILLASDDAVQLIWVGCHAINVTDYILAIANGHPAVCDVAFAPQIPHLLAACVAAAAPVAAAPASAKLSRPQLITQFTTAISEGQRVHDPGAANRARFNAIARELQRQFEDDVNATQRMRESEQIKYLFTRINLLHCDNLRLNQALSIKYVAPSRASQPHGACMLSCFLTLLKAKLSEARADRAAYGPWLDVVDAQRARMMRLMDALSDADGKTMVRVVRAEVIVTGELALKVRSVGMPAAQHALDKQQLQLLAARAQWDETDASDVLPTLSNMFCVTIRWTQQNTTHVESITPSYTRPALCPLIEMALVPSRWMQTSDSSQRADAHAMND